MAHNDGHITISVVIPVHNGQHTICRTVNSVLKQSHLTHEIIVVDDASTDSTVSLLHERYSGKIRLIQKKVNEGSSAARNAGIDAATGTHIAFLDADDIWHKDKLKATANTLQQSLDIALLFHHYTLRPIENDIIPSNIKAQPLSFTRLLPGNIISTSTAVIKNNPTFRFAHTMRYTEDYDLWLRIAYSHKVAYLPCDLTQLFRPVTSGGGISSRKWQMRKGEMKAYLRLANLNPLFILIIPFLLLTSILKHLLKTLGIFKPKVV